MVARDGSCHRQSQGYSVIKDVFTALPMNAVGIGFPIEQAYRETHQHVEMKRGYE
jgi:hypothetical protein